MKSLYFLLFLSLFVSAETLWAQSTVTCPDCNGTRKVTEACGNCHNGAVFCDYCSGRGRIDNTCSQCNGAGYVQKTRAKTCPYCNGQRYREVNQPVSCTCRGGKRPISQGGRVVYVDCSRCGGSGQLDHYVRVACRYCGGKGQTGTEIIQERCSCHGGAFESTCGHCHGRGAYMCPKCQGYASIQRTCGRCNGNGYIYVYNE